MDKVWRALVIFGSIFAASWSVYAIFETKEAHKTDVENLREVSRLELRAFAAEFASEMGQKQAEIMLPSILKAIRKYHPDDHSFLDTDKVEVMADGKISE